MKYKMILSFIIVAMILVGCQSAQVKDTVKQNQQSITDLESKISNQQKEIQQLKESMTNLQKEFTQLKQDVKKVKPGYVDGSARESN